MKPYLRSYYKHREKRIVEMRDQRNEPRVRASCLLTGARRRATKAGLEFALDLEWIATKIEAGRCEVTGLPFVLVFGRHAFEPSLDRIDPAKGYTKDNVQAVL